MNKLRILVSVTDIEKNISRDMVSYTDEDGNIMFNAEEVTQALVDEVMKSK